MNVFQGRAMKLDMTKSRAELTGDPAARRPIRREALHMQVVEKLRQLVNRGDIAAGERINELQIAAALGVSRTPLREAVKLLASEGLLELLPGRGSRVRRLTAEEIRDHFEVIGALERHAVEEAVAKMTPKGRAELEQLNGQMKEAFATGDRRAYYAANQRAHALFVRLAQSPALQETHETLTKRARHDRPVTLASTQRWAESMAEHAELLAAVYDGDAAKAGSLMLLHIRRTGEAMADIARRKNNVEATEQLVQGKRAVE
jgi:DNA-binding GntR family transcriptional regulator